ncbi:late control gene D protein (GPD) [Kushneria sinocarnis]|uniref:Late control gene D protein (GPD) n=2 Tax=Kushneria sinocarnis TaxID=595502 RepID=A0A420WUX9_9GAMM|nr:late control gene D protein (GPD) [Kushneria sinocarnis]
MLTRVAKPGGSKLLFVARAASRAVAAAGGAGSNSDASGMTENAPELPTVAITPEMVTSGRMTLSERKSPGKVVARWRDVVEAITREITAGTGDPVQRLSQIFPDAESATAAARSALTRGERSGQSLKLTLPGMTTLMAEGRVSLSGFRTGADGEWLLTKVEHTLDEGGYKCSIQGECPN